jgi:hypothetical protein
MTNPAPLPFAYRFHGVSVGSFIDLPDLEVLPASDPESSHPRISIRQGTSELLQLLPVTSYDIRVSIEDVVDFLIPEGAVIRYHPGGQALVDRSASMPQDLLQHIIIGQLLPNALADLGFLCLHASCVEIHGQALAFLGDSGMGKSSLAAACVAQGIPLLGDDCIPMRWEGEQLLVHRGPRRMKLWPDTIDALGLRSQAKRPIHGGEIKYLVDAGIASQAVVPLRYLFLLTPGPQPVIEAVDGRAIIPTLYSNIFGHRRQRAASRSLHFHATTRLALSSMVKRLVVPRDLQRLREVFTVLLAC